LYFNCGGNKLKGGGRTDWPRPPRGEAKCSVLGGRNKLTGWVEFRGSGPPSG